MKIKKLSAYILGVFFILVFAFSIGAFSVANNFTIKDSPYTYTFSREHIQSNGEKVEFFQSGDSDFIYYHDKYGNLLTKYKNNIFYADNIGGAPVASDVLFSNRFMLGHPKMQVEDIDFEANPDLIISRTVAESDVSPNPVLSNNLANLEIKHIVIYIAFEKETSQFGESKFNQLFLNSGSLKDYFSTISYENVLIDSILPRDENSAVVIYRDPNPRSYYATSGLRNKKEAQLLTNAVAAVSDMLEVEGLDIDVNLDNYVDAVTFMIGGKSSANWGTLLWPHQWNLHDINKAYNATNVEKAKIGGKFVGNYAFQFFDDAYPGIIAHEFSHVLGAPDLYHYVNDHVPVGKWDIMQTQLNLPQYPLAYTREKYLSSMPTDGIKEITSNGTFNLPSVAVATKGETIAYRINTEKINEFIMLEYRYVQPKGKFDEGLPGSGLIVYRVNTSAKDGNKNAKYQDIYNPDEILVYRPNTYSEESSLSRYTNSRINVDQAFLSVDNINFSQIGLPITTATAAYDKRTLYLTDGKNTGIEIKAITQTPEEISFSVKQTVTGDVPDDYFDNKISLSSAKSIFSDKVEGIEANFQTTLIERSKISSIEIHALDKSGNIVGKNVAHIDYLADSFEQGKRVFQTMFVYKEKDFYVQDFQELFLETTRPVSLQLVVYDTDGDEIIMNKLPIDYTDISFENMTRDNDDFKPRVFATARATFGVDVYGNVISSPNREDGQWGANNKVSTIAIAAGKTHTVLLTKDNRVQAFGSNLYGEINIKNDIEPIIAVQAGANNTFLLTPKGTIIAYGNLNGGLEVARSFSNITKMSIYDNFLVAVQGDGSVVTAGTNPNIDVNRLSNLRNIAAVSVGQTFVAFLTKDGRVLIEGNVNDSNVLTDLSGVTQISAGRQHLLALTEKGEVYALGDNSYGQIDTVGLVDIIDIATADKHSVFLRIDGVVEFRGVGDDVFDVTKPIRNLIHSNYIEVTSIDAHLNSNRIKVGGTAEININILPDNATYKNVIYYIEDPSIIKAENGVIKALSVGTTNITVITKDGGYSDTIQIEVYEDIYVTSISFPDKSITVLPNTRLTLQVIKNPSNYNIEGTMRFLSSDTNIVTVDSATGAIVTRNYGVATITATFRYLESTVTAVIEVKVASDVLSIELESSPKSDYKYGEILELSQTYLLVTTSEGTTKKAVTVDMITGYNNQQLGEQKLSITYLDKVITYWVVVSNFVSKIEIMDPPKSMYFLGEPLISSGSLKFVYANGDVMKTQIMANMIQGYDQNTLGKQDVLIIYGEFFLKHIIFVEDIVESISCAPHITVYQYMQEIELTEVITVNYRSGNTAFIDLALCKLSGYDKDKIGVQIVEIVYFDEKAKKEHITTINVKVALSNYSFVDKKEVYSYEVGKPCPIDMSIFLTQLDITIPLADNPNITYTITQGNMPFLFNKEGEGQAYVTVYITEKYIDSGRLTEKKKEIETIEIKMMGLLPIEKIELYYKNQKTDFLKIDYGTKLNLDSEDIILYITSNRVTKKVKPTAINIDYDILNAEQTAEFCYYNYSLSIRTYIDNKINGLIADPGQEEYQYGKPLSINVYWVKLNNEKVKAAEGSYSIDYDKLNIGITKVVITAAINGKEFSYSFEIKIVNYITEIIVVEKPKQNYKYLDNFDPMSRYLATMADGSSLFVWYNSDDFSHDSISKLNIGVSEVTITHRKTNKKWVYAVETSNYCVQLVVEKYQKNYIFGSDLSITLTATMADNAALHLTEKNIIHNFNPQKLGNQDVIITYFGASVTISVTVIEALQKLEIKREPTKKSYRYGEAIDYTGISVCATKTDGSMVYLYDNDVRQYASGYKANVSGNQIINITYHLKTVQFVAFVAAIKPLITALADGVTVNNANKYIALKSSTTYANFFSKMTLIDYLVVRNITCDEESNMNNKHKIVLLNKDGDIVIEYDIYLYGDANFDGVFDKEDIPHLFKLYLSSTKYYAILDYNQDGKIMLSDILGLTRKISGTEPTQQVNDFFRIIIAPIKEDVVEETILLCTKK